MEIKIELNEQEQSWLEQIALNSGISTITVIKILIKEKHEAMAMDMAYDTRGSRKAALKRSLIEKASKKLNDD